MTKENMPTMTWTGFIITGTVIILGIYDCITVLHTGLGSSISAWMINAGFKSPVLVFACGFVAGHIFGYMALPTKEIRGEG